MTKFNVGKFNVKNSEEISISAIGEMLLNAEIKNYLLEKYLEKTGAELNFDSKAFGFVELKGLKTSGELKIESSAIASNLVYGDKLTSDLIVDAYAIGSLLGEDYVEITGLSLKPGQELEIDMCALTLTINGENAMHLMSADGDFFDFLVGDNDIEIEAIGADKVQIDTYWKDRWL